MVLKTHLPVFQALLIVGAVAWGFQCLFAQEGRGSSYRAERQRESALFDPYVSGLRADAAGSQVALSWQDSSSVTGPVFVYRSKESFYGGTTSNQFQAMQVPYGAQSFTDSVPSNGTWYYLIVASEEGANQRYEMVVPFNNMLEVYVDGNMRSVQATSWTVPQSTPQAYSQAQAAEGRANPAAFRSQALSYGTGGMGDSLPFADMAASPFSGITATPQDNGVLVQFMSSAPGKNAILYRAITPIRKFGDLLVATVAKLGVSSPHLDHVTPGVPYYYAVVYEEDLMNGQAVLSPGNSTTLSPVETSRTVTSNLLAPPAAPASRYAPVPQTAPLQASATGKGASGYSGQTTSVIPDAAPTSIIRSPGSVSSQAIAPVSGSHVPLIMEARVFNEDLQKRAGGTDEGDLGAIVQRTIMWRNWNEGRGALMRFLTDKQRGAAAEARAHFYLGECAYFLGLYREALPEFVAVQTAFPLEAASWVQACLAKIAGR